MLDVSTLIADDVRMSNLSNIASIRAANLTTSNLSVEAARRIRCLPTTETMARAIYRANAPTCDLCSRESETQWCGPCGEREYSRAR